MSTLFAELDPSAAPPAPAECRTRSASIGPFRRPSPDELPKRILYVDDDALFRRYAELALLRSGHSVQTANDGAEAWVALRGQEFDLLITDNQMPRLTGLELICKVRQAGRAMPIILASSTVDEIPWPDCSAMLAKPFTVEQLLATVRRILRATVRVDRTGLLRLPPVEGCNLDLPEVSMTGH